MLKEPLAPDLRKLIENKDYNTLKNNISIWEPIVIAKLLFTLPQEDQPILFRLLGREKAADVFAYLPAEEQEQLLTSLASDNVRNLLDELDPDDRTRLFEELPAEITQKLMALLSPDELRESRKLLGYPEDSIGRLMTPDYIAIHPDWTIGESLEYIRKYGRDAETVNVIYIVDENSKLTDDLRLRTLILSDPEKKVSSFMDYHFVSLSAYDDQEKGVRMMQDYDRVALPVTDSLGTLIGIVTVDDIMDVLQEETTEDIHKLGGLEAIDTPYLSTPFSLLIKKRARWLVFLFLGEMLTATAMGYFQNEIARAVVLALFVPLIISSGGNSGSQAATLIIRAMAVGEITLRDWWRVMRREIFSGLSLGAILGIIGFLRIMIWQQLFHLYGVHWVLVGITVTFTLLGVVMWGTLSGSMLPFVLRSFGIDPATSSAPFVATLVDVTGLVIYFSIAALLLSGTLL